MYRTKQWFYRPCPKECPTPCVNSELGNNSNAPVPFRLGWGCPTVSACTLQGNHRVDGDGGAALCQTSASRVQARGDIPKCTRYTEHTFTWKSTGWQRFPAARVHDCYGLCCSGQISLLVQSARMVERCIVRAQVRVRPLGPGPEIGTSHRASTRATDLHFHGQFVWSDVRR